MAKENHVQLAVVAYHEAGHVVAALLLGLRLKRASIIPRGSVGGFVRTTPFPKGIGKSEILTLMQRDRIERGVKAAWAGMIAERMYSRRGDKNHHGLSDAEVIDAHLGLLTNDEKEKEAWAELLWIQTHNLIKRHYRLVEIVAAALLEHRSMKARDLEKLCLAELLANQNHSSL